MTATNMCSNFVGFRSSPSLKLRPTSATVISCGHQAFALRSHLDRWPVMIEDVLVNRGNLQALLRFRVDAGDQVLKEHLEPASLNATYTSKEIPNQNDITMWWYYTK